jgi:hypothetical protein
VVGPGGECPASARSPVPIPRLTPHCSRRPPVSAPLPFPGVPYMIGYSETTAVLPAPHTSRPVPPRARDHHARLPATHCRCHVHWRFALGQNRVLWRGLYGNDREPNLAAFVARLPTLAPALADFVRLIRFQLAPLTCHTRLRRRIEAALAQHLSRQPGLVGPFQDAGIHYTPRRASEELIAVLCRSSTMLLGLPARLEA